MSCHRDVIQHISVHHFEYGHMWEHCVVLDVRLQSKVHCKCRMVTDGHSWWSHCQCLTHDTTVTNEHNSIVDSFIICSHSECVSKHALLQKNCATYDRHVWITAQLALILSTWSYLVCKQDAIGIPAACLPLPPRPGRSIVFAQRCEESLPLGVFGMGTACAFYVYHCYRIMCPPCSYTCMYTGHEWVHMMAYSITIYYN